MSVPQPGDDAQARLPVELADTIIDYLDRPSLVLASLVSKSWHTRATARLFRRLEIWSGSSVTCARSRMPRRSCVQMSCALFAEMLDRNKALFRPVRELHLVFAGSRLGISRDAQDELDAMLRAASRLSFCEIEYLGLYSFPSNLSPMLNELITMSTNLRSLHIVDFNTVDLDILSPLSRRLPCLNQLAVLEGSATSSVNVDIPTFAPNTHRAPSARVIPEKCQVFLALYSMVDLLTWVAHAPPTRRTLNIVGVRAFTFPRCLDELLATHPPFQLDDIMSCVRSLEIVIDYEDPYRRIAKLLQAFLHVPNLQFTFDSDSANLQMIARLLRDRRLDWSFLQHIIFAPRPHPRAEAAIGAQWDLLDTALADNEVYSSLESVVVSLRDDAELPQTANGITVPYLPQLQGRGIVRIVRRESDGAQTRFLPCVADESMTQML